MHYVCVRKGSKYWQTRLMSFYHLLVGFVFTAVFTAGARIFPRRNWDPLCKGENVSIVEGLCQGTYCIPDTVRHRPPAKSLLHGECPERPTHIAMHAIFSLVKGDVVTAGLFNGDMVPQLVREVGNHTVWGIEPIRVNFDAAKLTAQYTGVKNVRLTRGALAETSGGTAPMITSCNGVSRGSGARRERGTARSHPDERGACATEMTPLVAIDDIVPLGRHVALIHLDVEGEEVNALKGALKTLRASRPWVLFEEFQHEKNKAMVISALLKDEGCFKVDYLALAAMSVWSCSPEIGMPNFIAKDIFDAAHAEARRDHAAD